MLFLASILPTAQVILSVLLITAVLLQQSEAGLGAAFGGEGGSGFRTKRGAERVLFISTIVLGALFAATALLALILKA